MVTNLSRSSSNKKPGVAPMKILIAQEMSKGMETWQKPPTVVARLMGLDALPAQPSPTVSQRVNAECITHRSCSTGRTVWAPLKHEPIHYERMMLNRDQHFHSHFDNMVYKDVYEVSQKASKTKFFKEESSSGEGCDGSSINKRMSLVCQKFMEAKHLASNQALVHSKEFRDAIEVLSSNRDEFVKSLEESNSLFSDFAESQPAPIPDQHRHITVLKPTKACDEGSEQITVDQFPKEAANGCGKNMLNRSAEIIHPKEECFSHKTKIVILRPSPGKFNDNKHKRKSSFDELGSDGSIRSRDVAKETIQCMQESLSGHVRNETSISSVLSNGYFGDESSFNRSESDYMEEECDTEVMTPTSRLSWDYMSRLGSPSSEFSFRHTSFLPESSVIIEAKKRLSARWTMVTSSQMNQEQTQEWRNGNTLGEMLSFRETNKEGKDETLAASSGGLFGGEQESNVTSSYLFSKGEDVKNCLSVQRFKYAHASSKDDNAGMDMRDPGYLVKWLDKPKKGKSTLKGKVSNFFSRNKKSIVETHSSIHLAGPGDKIQLGEIESHEGPPYTFEKLLMMDSSQISRNKKSIVETHSSIHLAGPGDKIQLGEIESHEGPPYTFEKLLMMDSSQISRNKKSIVETHSSIHLAGPGDKIQLGKIESHEGPPYTFEKLLMMDSSQISGGSDQQMTSSLEQYLSCEDACGYKEHPSPVSVLEGPYRNISMQYSDTASIGCQRTISRSPSIESVARSLSWECDKCLGRTSLNSSKHLHSCLSADVEKEERLLFVQSLLSSAGLSTETSDTFLARWHSADTPLNPALLDKLLVSNDGTWCRGKLSNLKLLFDCVNTALLDISLVEVLLPVDCFRISSKISATTSVTKDVLRRIDDWFCNDKLIMFCYGSNKSFEVDMVVRQEVSGNRWLEMIGSETAAVGLLIEDQILDGLLGEALEDFISGLLQ